VIRRFGTAFGISHRYRFDLVVNLLTAKAVRDGQITIHGVTNGARSSTSTTSLERWCWRSTRRAIAWRGR